MEWRKARDRPRRDTSLGVATAIFVVVALFAALASSLRAPAARIIVRVAGSWIVAAALFMLGWALRVR